MSDTPQLFPLSDQPPFIQLIVSSIVILVSGIVFILLFVLGGSLLFRTNISQILSTAQGAVSENSELIFKYLQAIQGISLFIIPSFIISVFMTNGRGNWLLIKNIPNRNAIVLVVCLAVLMIPVTSATGLLNSGMTLPQWLRGLETWMKAKEDTATYLTGVLLAANSIPALIINLFVIAILPAVGEELLFRGVIQQIFQKMFKSGNWAVWVTAIIFSSIHLQFYGFLPRLILGLVFGYLFYWGRSMWLPVIAHLVNNAIPVISSNFMKWDQINNKTQEFVETNILFIMFSVITSLMILLYFRNIYLSNKSEV